MITGSRNLETPEDTWMWGNICPAQRTVRARGLGQDERAWKPSQGPSVAEMEWEARVGLCREGRSDVIVLALEYLP